MPEPLQSLAHLIHGTDQRQPHNKVSADNLLKKLKEIYLHNLYVQRSLALMAMSLERAKHDSQVNSEQAETLLSNAISRLKQL